MTDFEKPQGKVGERVTVCRHEELGKIAVRTLEGSTHTTGERVRARQYASFGFLDLPDLPNVVDLEDPSDRAPEWRDWMHDYPRMFIQPRILRAIEEARRQQSHEPMYAEYLESGLAERALRRLSRKSPEN